MSKLLRDGRMRATAAFTALALLAQLTLPAAVLAHDFVVPGGASPGIPGNPDGGQEPPNNPACRDPNVQCDFDPVDIHRGDFVLRRSDIFLPGRGLSVDLTFTYRSRSAYNGSFGYGWDLSYNKRVRKLSDNNVILLRGDTRKDKFTYNGTTTYDSPAGVYDTLAQNPDGTWTLTTTHGLKEHYDLNGNLATIEDRNGNMLTFTYDPAGLRPITGQSAYFVNQATGVIAREYLLTQITDPSGRAVNFTYTSEGRLDTLTYEGRTITYGYDPAQSGDLLTVTMPPTSDVPSGTTTIYAYLNHNLTTVTDPKGQQYVTNQYDPTFDCLTQQTYGTGTSTLTHRNSFVCPTGYGMANPGYSVKLTPLVATPGTGLTVTWTAPASEVVAGDGILLFQHGSSTAVAAIPTNGATLGTDVIPTFGSTPNGLYEARYTPSFFPYGQINPPTATSNLVTLATSLPPASVDVIDRKGFRTMYTFDSEGHITQMEQFTDGDPPGEPPSYVTRYEYDAGGNRTRAIFPRGNAIEMTYDAKGNLTEIRRKKIGAAPHVNDPSDLVTTFTYESSFNFIKTLTDPRSNVTTYTYDYELGESAHGNLRKITFPLVSGGNPLTVLTYTGFGQVETVADPNANVTKYVYDPTSGYLTSITQGYGSADAATTQLGYDAVGNVTSVTNANSHATTFTYNELNQLTTVTAPSPLSVKTFYTYDANGNLIQVDRQAKSGSPGARPPAGTTDPTDDWQSTAYTHTTLDQLHTITDDLGHVTQFAYDPNGNRTSITDANTNTTTYAYDERNLLQRVFDAAIPQGVTEYTYDDNGNLKNLNDAKSNPTTYTYDDFDRLTQTTYADNSVEHYAYDATSNLTLLTRPSTEAIQYTYDALNRLDLKTYVGPNTTFDYVYDLGSRLTDLIDATGTLHYDYDALNRVKTAVSPPGSKTIRYTYDGVGNRKTLTYPDGTALSYVYDTLERLTKLQQGSAVVAKYSYDALSRRVRTALQNGTGTTYRYDATNRLLQLDNVLLPGFAWNRPATWMTAMGHHAPEPIKRAAAQVSDWLMPQADALPHGTNPGPQQPPSTLLSSFAYTYDAVGNRLTMTDGVGTHAYTYDPLHQLTTVDYPSGFGATDTTYTLDGVGNRLKTVDGGTTTYVPTSVNQYATVGGVAFTYDLNGNLTFDGVNTYTYDRENHLLSATGAFGSVTYTADALGRRSKKVLNGTTTRYLYDGDQILHETDATGTILATYVYGPGIDEPLRMERGGQQYSYFFDGLGSVIALTNSAGSVVESTTYDVYGRPLTTSTLGNRYLFTGREYDQETGLYNYRRRYYDPGIGRFISRDPLGEAAGVNLYTYVDNNPLNWIDPFGLEKDRPWDWYLNESVVPGPRGQPLSEWGPEGPTSWGDPLKYTEAAGGAWMWAERAAVGTAAVATSVAVCAPAAQQAVRRGGWLNSNPYLRIGWGRRGGERVFRLGGKWIQRITGRPHIDLWEGGPL